jgi:hypothetical protein
VRRIRWTTTAFVLLLATTAAAGAEVSGHNLALEAARHDAIELAADLTQGACQYYASPPTDPLCVNTTEPLCKKYHLSVWRKGYTCPDVERGACQYYLSDGVTGLCLTTTRVVCKGYYMSHWYPGETCSD